MATFVADNKEDADRVQELFNEVRLQNENQLPFLCRPFFHPLFILHAFLFLS